jgi:hypothetical protein
MRLTIDFPYRVSLSCIARVSIYRCIKRKILFQDFECCWGFPEYPFRAHARAEMTV